MSGWRENVKVGLPRLAVVAHDLIMVWVAWYGLHQLRFGLMDNPPPFPAWSTETALVLSAQALVFWQVGLYRGLWRFASVPDLWNIVKACVIGVTAIIVLLVLYSRMEGISRAAVALYP